MPNLHLVSVIMPMYNAEKTVRQAIESVIAQSYTNWELIIVDDGSTDTSVEIASSYELNDARIKLHKSEKNIGSPYHARNYATERATGKYIAFLDSDDLWLPYKLTKQISFMQDNDFPIVYSFYEKFSHDGIRSNRIIKSALKTDYKRILRSNPIGCLTAVYDQDKIGKLYQIDHKHEDYIMWIRILKKGFIAYCYPEVLALYRISANSVSNSKIKMAKVTWDIYRNVIKLGFFASLRSFFFYSTNGLSKYFK